MTPELPLDYVRCDGTDAAQCAGCMRRQPGSIYTPNMSPTPANERCHFRLVTMATAKAELCDAQGRGD